MVLERFYDFDSHTLEAMNEKLRLRCKKVWFYLVAWNDLLSSICFPL